MSSFPSVPAGRFDPLFRLKARLPLSEPLRQKVCRGIVEVPLELERLLHRAYPGFVTARHPPALLPEVPVFMFHKVRRHTFEEQLHFLQRNSYRTLSLRDYCRWLDGRLRLKTPAVLLTFDDGDKSLQEIARPLLQQYDFQAAAFLVPSRIREREASQGWLCWGEVEELLRSGVVDIQSHSFYHQRIFISPRLVDFYHPGFDANPLGLDTPWLGQEAALTNRLDWGTPLYEHAPSLAGLPRYLDDAECRRLCTTLVATRGAEAFFRRPSWRRELARLLARTGQSGLAYESFPAQRARMLHDLQYAKTALEERLNKRIEHLCYPWGQGSDLAVSLSKEAGYRSNFWVVPPRGAPRKSPFHLARVKDDYLFRLPGSGRRPLARIFRAKLEKRVQSLDLY